MYIQCARLPQSTSNMCEIEAKKFPANFPGSPPCPCFELVSFLDRLQTIWHVDVCKVQEIALFLHCSCSLLVQSHLFCTNNVLLGYNPHNSRLSNSLPLEISYPIEATYLLHTEISLFPTPGKCLAFQLVHVNPHWSALLPSVHSS